MWGRRSMMLRVAWIPLVVLAACAARAEPIVAQGRVVVAGARAPVAPGSACTLRLWPAWRSGVNCQMLLTCAGTDLFGGKRIGGYAVCDVESHRFKRAIDEETLEDPAVDVDLVARHIRWRDRAPGVTIEIALSEVSPAN